MSEDNVLKVDSATYGQIRRMAVANGWVLIKSEGRRNTDTTISRVYCHYVQWLTNSGNLVELEVWVS